MGRIALSPPTRTERVNLLLTPEVKTSVKKIATVRRTTVNSLINEVLEDYALEHKNEIDRYDNFFEEGNEV